MGENSALLELQGVSKRYDDLGGAGVVDVLSGVDLLVQAGHSVSVTGPSGSGKSTLLNIIAGLDRPTAGRVLLDGQDLSQLSDRQLARIRSSRIGMVFQLHHLLPQCTVMENVLVPTMVCPDAPADPTVRAAELLDRVGLGERLSHRPGQLSGGERQRVAVVRALINSPQLLLADEPTGSLDRVAADSLAELLVELNREQGVTLIVATHWEALAAKMDRTMVLRDGAIVEAVKS